MNPQKKRRQDSEKQQLILQRNSQLHGVLLAALLAVAAFGFFAVQAQLPAYALVFSSVMAATLILQMAREQLQQRQLAAAAQWGIPLAAVAVWAIPEISGVFNILLVLWGLAVCLIYALFAGWIMKISHLRKAMNFSNEAFYNIWRIAVRIALPIAIIAAIAAVLGKLF